MNLNVVQKLNQTNTNFYSQVCDSFSDTRSVPWQGWDGVLDCFANLLVRGDFPNSSAEGITGATRTSESRFINIKSPLNINIRDVGCGNMRFMRFVLDKLPAKLASETGACPDEVATFNFENIDNSSELMSSVPASSTTEHDFIVNIHQDIIESLISGAPIGRSDEFKAHLSCSFGVFHHIPTMELRKKFLYEMAQGCQENGLIAISLWQFMNDERIARKATDFSEYAARKLEIDPGSLDQRDYFLGWKDSDTAIRYCHHFSRKDINELTEFAKTIGLDLKQSFEADGKNDGLNRYLIFQLN